MPQVSPHLPDRLEVLIHTADATATEAPCPICARRRGEPCHGLDPGRTHSARAMLRLSELDPCSPVAY